MLNRTFTLFPILTTERLTLRQLKISDEKEIFTLRSDSEINKYLNRERSKTIDDARNFINKINDKINKNDSIYWAITLTDEERFAGTICLFDFSDENNKCEMGYELLTHFQGQGIMQEAAKKVIEYCFRTIRLQTLEAFSHIENQSSINLLTKLSFKTFNDPDKRDPELLGFHLTNSTS